MTPDTEPVPWYWNRVDLFDGTERSARDSFFSSAKRIEYRPKQMIFSAEDAGDQVFLLERGMVKIFALSSFGDITIFWFCKAGDLFGAGAISGAGEQSVYAQAVQRAAAWTLPRSAFEALIRAHPQFGINVIRLMGARLRLACDAVTDRITRRTDARLARILLRMAHQWGRREDSSIRLEAPVTHQELANIAGATRQTITQTLKQFERAGWLKIELRRITLIDPAQLARLAETDGRPREQKPSRSGASADLPPS